MRSRRTLIGTAALAITIVVTSASNAAAVTIRTNGSPGSAEIPYAYARYASFASGTITAPARTVHESPVYARRDQYVCVTPRLWALSTNLLGHQRWKLDDKLTDCRWIRAASTSVAVNGAEFSELDPYIGYSVDVVITWQLKDGTRIGKRIYDYTFKADYQCLTEKCRRDKSTIGAYVMFDF